MLLSRHHGATKRRARGLLPVRCPLLLQLLLLRMLCCLLLLSLCLLCVQGSLLLLDLVVIHRRRRCEARLHSMLGVMDRN